ncbi:cellulose biosynthesis protein CelD, partial [Paraburkholderia sp. SIMBA_049]
QVDADVLEIPLVEEDCALQRALCGTQQSWVLALTPGLWHGLPGFSIRLRDVSRWEDFVSTLPKSLRSSLRYRHNKLETQGHPEFGWCRTVSDAASVLTWLFDNKR